MPAKQSKHCRLWFNDGSCIRLKPLFKHHVWSYDFVADRIHEGRPLRILPLIDEYSREYLAIRGRRTFKAREVIEVLAEQFIKNGLPANIRSDNGPEFTSRVGGQWLENLMCAFCSLNQEVPGRMDTTNLSIKLRDELFNGEIFTSLTEAQTLIERWRREYNEFRPHSDLNHQPPSPEAIMQKGQIPTSLRLTC